LIISIALLQKEERLFRILPENMRLLSCKATAIASFINPTLRLPCDGVAPHLGQQPGL
jgi:hypothetical protein